MPRGRPALMTPRAPRRFCFRRFCVPPRPRMSSEVGHCAWVHHFTTAFLGGSTFVPCHGISNLAYVLRRPLSKPMRAVFVSD